MSHLAWMQVAFFALRQPGKHTSRATSMCFGPSCGCALRVKHSMVAVSGSEPLCKLHQKLSPSGRCRTNFETVCELMVVKSKAASQLTWAT